MRQLPTRMKPRFHRAAQRFEQDGIDSLGREIIENGLESSGRPTSFRFIGDEGVDHSIEGIRLLGEIVTGPNFDRLRYGSFADLLEAANESDQR